ncbi:MAG TPA: DUF3800 domain-containing protein [Longimicrobium sp.]|jgi:hypothetical protein
MYLFYIDESGNTGTDLDTADQPVHWMVALGVAPAALKRVEEEMLALAVRHFPERARAADFEFHGSHIYARRGDCRGLRAEAAVQLYGELLDVLARNGGLLFIVGIDKAKLKRRAQSGRYAPDHPYRLAFMYLVERIDGWLHERAPRAATREVLGLLVADEQKEVHRQMIESFAAWRAKGTQYSSRGKAIRHLVDTVHYVPSHDSWLIQLADCVAYIFSRYHRIQREKGELPGDALTLAEAAVVRLWNDRCRKRLVEFYLWPG